MYNYVGIKYTYRSFFFFLKKCIKIGIKRSDNYNGHYNCAKTSPVALSVQIVLIKYLQREERNKKFVFK